MIGELVLQNPSLWADKRIVYTIAFIAILLLVVTIWLFRRRQRSGRGAAVVCLFLSIALHAALIFLIPMISGSDGATSVDPDADESIAGSDTISFQTFDPDASIEAAAADAIKPSLDPLPLNSIFQSEFVEPAEIIGTSKEETESESPESESPESESPESESPESESPEPESQSDAAEAMSIASIPDSLGRQSSAVDSDDASFESFSELFTEEFEKAFSEQPSPTEPKPSDLAKEASARLADNESTPEAEINDSPGPDITQAANAASDEPTGFVSDDSTRIVTKTASTIAATVPGDIKNDFAARVGKAKTFALQATGGDVSTEQAVARALRFLTNAQSDNGSWSAAASGAGRERAPLGTTRSGAGRRCDMALTGLSLLTLLGAGQTHQHGDYSENIYRGLAYLIQKQQPSGSLAGRATTYAATYSHGMAALAMSEAAAITQDSSAIRCTEMAVRYTLDLQHPTTGGWRYTAGDPGDLSQLGWQAMVLDAGERAGVKWSPRSKSRVTRFLDSVKSGRSGGLASYRPRETPSRTMTAEAMATRLLMNQSLPEDEVREAERYLLEQPPGVGQDNYYYWYYATLALHQMQDDAWRKWNDALKNRLLATQRSDGSWSDRSVWGGYGGTVYSTAMATLCLETYYRHRVRGGSSKSPQQQTAGAVGETAVRR